MLISDAHTPPTNTGWIWRMVMLIARLLGCRLPGESVARAGPGCYLIERDPGYRSGAVSGGTAGRAHGHRRRARARPARRRVLRHREPRRVSGAHRPHVCRGATLPRAADGRQARVAHERAQ